MTEEEIASLSPEDRQAYKNQLMGIDDGMEGYDEN